MLETLALVALALMAAAAVAQQLFPSVQPVPQGADPRQEGRAIQQAFLSQTKEATLDADDLKHAQRLTLSARRIGEGVAPERVAATVGRMPAQWQAFHHVVSKNAEALRLLAAAALEAIRDHMLGRKAMAGLPSVADAVEAFRRDVAVEALPAARKIQGWQATGRTLTPAHSTARSRNRAKSRKRG